MSLLREAEHGMVMQSQKEEALHETRRLLVEMYDVGIGLLYGPNSKSNLGRIERFMYNVIGLRGRSATREFSANLEIEGKPSITVLIDDERANDNYFVNDDVNVRIQGLPSFLKISPNGFIDDQLPQYGSSIVKYDNQNRMWGEAHRPVSLTDARDYHEIMTIIRGDIRQV